MGMDVSGVNPSSETGEYFRNNVWWWRPLWNYCLKVAPELCESVSGHHNDGDGLDGEGAKALAEILQEKIDSGECKKYAEEYAAQLKALPDEKCDLCQGTGIRNDQFVQGKCNKCTGKGHVRPFDTQYPFSVENVQNFTNFLKDSGGFEIF